MGSEQIPREDLSYEGARFNKVLRLWEEDESLAGQNHDSKQKREQVVAKLRALFVKHGDSYLKGSWQEMDDWVKEVLGQ